MKTRNATKYVKANIALSSEITFRHEPERQQPLSKHLTMMPVFLYADLEKSSTLRIPFPETFLGVKLIEVSRAPLMLGAKCRKLASCPFYRLLVRSDSNSLLLPTVSISKSTKAAFYTSRLSSAICESELCLECSRSYTSSNPSLMSPMKSDAVIFSASFLYRSACSASRPFQ